MKIRPVIYDSNFAKNGQNSELKSEERKVGLQAQRFPKTFPLKEDDADYSEQKIYLKL